MRQDKHSAASIRRTSLAAGQYRQYTRAAVRYLEACAREVVEGRAAVGAQPHHQRVKRAAGVASPAAAGDTAAAAAHGTAAAVTAAGIAAGAAGLPDAQRQASKEA